MFKPHVTCCISEHEPLVTRPNIFLQNTIVVNTLAIIVKCQHSHQNRYNIQLENFHEQEHEHEHEQEHAHVHLHDHDDYKHERIEQKHE